MKSFDNIKVIKIFLFAFLLLATGTINGQVAIGTPSPNPSAQLDINSINKGFLPPRMTEAQRNAILTPAAGLMIWCKDCGVLGELQVYNGVTWTNLAGGAVMPASVNIGTQVWMTRNLDVVTYRNGDTIPEVNDKDRWDTLKTGAWCYYNNNSANGFIYGKLYNRAAVDDPRGLAPQGWHVSKTVEWQELFDYLSTLVSDKLRAKILWNTPITESSNESGFSALPGGQVFENGGFTGLGTLGIWWTEDTKHFYASPDDYGYNGYDLEIDYFSAVWETFSSYTPTPDGGYWTDNPYLLRNARSVRCVKD